jgi:hypothetical protein
MIHLAGLSLVSQAGGQSSSVKIRTIAFESLLRNKVILLFVRLFICIVFLMMTPLLAYKVMTTAANAQQMQGFVLNAVASARFTHRGSAPQSGRIEPFRLSHRGAICK